MDEMVPDPFANSQNHRRMSSRSDRLRRIDSEHVWHPFAPMQTWREERPPIIARGEGFFLYDVDGRKYLDGISALWCNVHGFQTPEIDDAVRSQLGRVAHTTLLGQSSVPSIELAERLVEITPAGLNKVFYSDNGSTAVEAALKIAWQYHRQKPGGPEPRDLFVSVGGAYHGDTIGSVSVGSIDLFHATYGGMLFETLAVPSPGAFRNPLGIERDAWREHCFQELERTIVEHSGRIAAFVIEPLVQGAAGILVHPSGYLKRVRALTAARGIPLIADEVAVGFGRTGRMFACEHEDVAPDLMCLAKGLSGGYLPVAATLATDEIYNAFLGEPHEGRTLFHGHTFTGNALGCAAAVASLDLFEKRRVLENVAVLEQRLSARLTEIADHPHVGDVRRRGIMTGIELVQDRGDDSPYPPELRMGNRVTRAARERGVIVRPLGDVVVLMPAPATPVALLDQVCDAVFDSIERATA